MSKSAKYLLGALVSANSLLALACSDGSFDTPTPPLTTPPAHEQTKERNDHLYGQSVQNAVLNPAVVALLPPEGLPSRGTQLLTFNDNPAQERWFRRHKS